ncbi:MAG: DUF1638 domain-containing protein [Caldilineaceae bacterium]
MTSTRCSPGSTTILLAYGLCGTATADLVARHTPIIMPKAHDCITLYLGLRATATTQSSSDILARTGTASTTWNARKPARPAVLIGHARRRGGVRVVGGKVGQETADALRRGDLRGWTKHYTRAAFIDTGLGDGGAYEKYAQDKAAAEG